MDTAISFLPNHRIVFSQRARGRLRLRRRLGWRRFATPRQGSAAAPKRVDHRIGSAEIVLPRERRLVRRRHLTISHAVTLAVRVRRCFRNAIAFRRLSLLRAIRRSPATRNAISGGSVLGILFVLVERMQRRNLKRLDSPAPATPPWRGSRAPAASTSNRSSSWPLARSCCSS